MAKAAPPFPAFEQWINLSEGEQDALLDRIERLQRRNARVRSLLVGVAIAAIAAALIYAGLIAVT